MCFGGMTKIVLLPFKKQTLNTSVNKQQKIYNAKIRLKKIVQNDIDDNTVMEV